ncbi:8014_t:CDS:2, partial [Dentiscutata erythropus]
HEITRNGIRPDNEKVIKVQEYPAPKTLRQLKGFLDLSSYYKWIIKENWPEEAREVFKVDVICIEDSKDEWYSENEDYKEDYEDKGDYESEVEEMDYERTDSIEEHVGVESGRRLLWEGHSDIAQQWWEYKNGKGAEMSLSQDEVYLVDDLRAIQDGMGAQKNVPWPLTPEEVIEASEEENDPKYEDDEGLSDGNYSSSSQWEMSNDDESQIEVVINSRSTSLTTPEEEILTEEWKPKDDQEKIFEPQVIDIGTKGIRKTQRFKSEFFSYDYPTLNGHIVARELTLREAVYWVDFYGYPLIANNPNKLLILQNRMQDEVRQSEARQLMAL